LKLDQELTSLVQRKRELERSLTTLESQIHQMETRYLNETPDGNVCVGFANYMAIATGQPSNQQQQQQQQGHLTAIENGSDMSLSTDVKWADRDRVFSQSSTTYRKVSVWILQSF
jgi:chromatin modification-related protein EAF6